VLGRTTGNSDSQDSPRPKLGGSHHLLHYSILYTSPQGPHPNGFLSRNSQVGVSKFPPFGLPRLWEPIILCADLWFAIRSEAKFYPSSRALQRYVARRLHAKESGQFPTFNGRESNLFWSKLVFQISKWVMWAHFRHLCFNSFPMI
jgi:hypothetical protein